VVIVIQLKALAVSFGESHSARDATQGQQAVMDERQNELKMQSNGSHGMINDHDGPKAIPQIGADRVLRDQNAPHGCSIGFATQGARADEVDAPAARGSGKNRVQSRCTRGPS
jgi:hypothetical protein